MSIWQFIVGIVVIIMTISFVVGSIIKTPENLRGWYGIMFGLIAIGGIVGGIALMTSAFVG